MSEKRPIDEALEALLDAYRKGGREAANEAFNREVEKHSLRMWEAAALADRFRKAIATGATRG